MQQINGLSYAQVEELVKACGQPAYRAGQLFGWLHQKRAAAFEDMKNLPQAFREQLAARGTIAKVTIEKKLVSQLDGTVKYLFSLPDGETVECVVMRYKHGLSICLSTQVGCKMGCSFCASTLAGYVRDLTAAEILDQIYTAADDLGERIGNIVLMGIGEPLDNYQNVLDFIRLVTDSRGMDLSPRHITLSTCGIVPGILKLADEGLPITLSISLHAPNDALRDQLMPVNRKYRIHQVLAACRQFEQKTGRRISFEYTLIDGVNDSRDCARQLADLCRGLMCHVNLIPVNKVQETGYTQSHQVTQFQAWLQDRGVNATVRRTLGQDISAACGQLRRQSLQQ